MQWKVEQYVFCERQQTLNDSQRIQQLEPMVVELLAYFCRNPNITVSRDQLIEHVWAGRIITDNAVTKLITKLRKYLGDDPKAPKFITTYPRKGYRFIAAVSEYTEPCSTPVTTAPNLPSFTASTGSDIANDKSINTNYMRLLAVSAAMCVFAIMVYFSYSYGSTQPSFNHVKPLTRDPGRESRPAISPDEHYLAYTEFRNAKMHLWIKSLLDETTIEISHGVSDSIWVDSATWNSDGSQLVYLVTTPNSCQYFVRDFAQLEVSEARLIHNCPAGSYGKIAFTHDDNRLIYSEAAARGEPFEIYELNLQTNEKRKLNQPALFIGGNSQFDVHPHDNKLLISSPDAQQWEGFYSLDLDTNELTLLFKQDAYICCGRWDHSGTRVILMGEHPTTTLVSFDLKGEDPQVIYSSSEQVRVPQRHPNGKDYVFPISQVNQNSRFYDFEDKVTHTIADSSVDDRLANIALHDDLIAYVGLSSGSEEIWLTNSKGEWKKKLSNLKGQQHYIDIGWSYDGNYLFGLTLNEIHLFEASTGNKKTLKLPQIEMRGVSWKNNQTLAMSLKTEKGWRVHEYSIESDALNLSNDEWQYIRYTLNPEDTLWQKEGKNGPRLFVGENQTAVADERLVNAGLLYGRLFNLQKSGARWAWNTFAKGRYHLYVKNLESATPIKVVNPDHFHFDMTAKGIVYQTSESIKSDLYVTMSNQ